MTFAERLARVLAVACVASISIGAVAKDFGPLSPTSEADDKKAKEAFVERLRRIHAFIDAIRVGMSASEVDAADRLSFDNPRGWGKTVNTITTADGSTQQWVYRFYNLSKINDVYIYLQNGVVTVIQK